MRPKPTGRFTLREIKVKKRLDGKPVEYSAFLLSGWRHGPRYRRQFKNRDEAIGEKNALEVEAANVGGELRARNTRLSADQLTAPPPPRSSWRAKRSLTMAIEREATGGDESKSNVLLILGSYTYLPRS
jgi:hypothetical protein